MAKKNSEKVQVSIGYDSGDRNRFQVGNVWRPTAAGLVDKEGGIGIEDGGTEIII